MPLIFQSTNMNLILQIFFLQNQVLHGPEIVSSNTNETNTQWH